MGSIIFKNLTKVNLIASYNISTIKYGDLEDDIVQGVYSEVKQRFITYLSL